MTIYLGMGSNLGDSKLNIFKAIDMLNKNNIYVVKCSPFQFNPAIMLRNSPDYYNIPFCNVVVEVQTSLNPYELLKQIKNIEIEMGG